MKTSPFSEQLFSCRDVARQLGTSDDTVRRLITGGFLDGIRVGRRCLCVPASAISRYLQAREPAHRLVISGEAKVSCIKAGQMQPAHTDAPEVEKPVAAPCPHHWNVVSTVLKDVSLLVRCDDCGAYGLVARPDANEWHLAFHAPSQPYPWPHDDRVEVIPSSCTE